MARVNNLTNFLNDVATAIKTKLGDNTSIPAAEFDSKIMEIETAGNYQNKSITITTNGNYNLLPDTGYDAMDQVSIEVNVPVEGSSDFNAKMLLTSITGTTADLSKYIVNIPVLDTSNIRNMNSTFYGCSALAEVPLLNTSNVTSMSNIFKNCTSLVDVPVFDTSALINMTNMFSSCPNLSNNSLNNILTMCINASSFNGVKTLKTLGLTSAQATTCQSLENYQDFIDAGWKTGY